MYLVNHDTTPGNTRISPSERQEMVTQASVWGQVGVCPGQLGQHSVLDTTIHTMFGATHFSFILRINAFKTDLS